MCLLWTPAQEVGTATTTVESPWHFVQFGLQWTKSFTYPVVSDEPWRKEKDKRRPLERERDVTNYVFWGRHETTQGQARAMLSLWLIQGNRFKGSP